MITLHVSPHGRDDWNGYLPEPAAHGKDGPLASLDEARKRAAFLREQNLACGSITIRLAGGRYPLAKPLKFAPRDSHLHILGDPQNPALIDGSVAVRDWTVTEHAGKLCWVADVGSLLAAMTPPRSFFVNGERRPRSRYPKTDWLAIEEAPDVPAEGFDTFDGAQRFVVREGDFDPAWRNPSDIEAVVNHLWIEERMPVAAYDAETRMLHCTHRSIFTLRNHEWMGETPCARYYFENVFEAMSEPGEWYLDTAAARLYYLPKDGETLENTELRLPAGCQLLRLHGDPETGQRVENIHFEHIHFLNTDWSHSQGWGRWWDPETPAHSWRVKDSFRHFNEDNLEKQRTRREVPFAAMPQAAHDLPGAVSLEAAAQCSFRHCTFRNLGFYAVDVRGGCQFNHFTHNRIEEIGGGGIKIDGADLRGDARLRTSHIHVADNTIRRCGRVFPSAIGVAILHAAHNTVEHNEICEQFYSAVSVGWTWRFETAICQQNRIRFNHIHHIGYGRLSDMGGIYTLGCQPGTVIEGNHIHHVSSGHYGGWGIYLDEGSSLIRVVNNLVHHTNSQALMEHWGRQNCYMGNTFALSTGPLIQLCREDSEGYRNYPDHGALFLENTCLSDGQPFFQDNMTYFETGQLKSDLNTYWDRQNPQHPVIWNDDPWPMLGGSARQLDLAGCQAAGLERHSRLADPGFKDPDGGDFTRADGSTPPPTGPRPPEAIPLPAAPTFMPKESQMAFSD